VDCVGTSGSPRWGQACGAYKDDRGGTGNITILLDIQYQGSPVKLTLGHCASAAVKPGDRVASGQQVGLSGGSGGDHVHVETSIQKNGTYWLVDPRQALAAAAGAPVVEKQFPFAPWPKGFDRRIVTKVGPGHGYVAVTPKRGDRLTHIVVHHTAGGPGFTKDECWKLFSLGGQREAEALTEAVLDRDGTGYLLNDPWSDNANEGSGRSPYASGPANKLSGAGQAFVAKYGIAAVNDSGFAIEHCHAAGERWADPMLDLGAKVYAVVLTRRRVPWDTFPRNPAGLWIGLHHDDFANTSCPQMPADVWAAYIDAIRGEMKKLQEPGSISPPGPAPEPEPNPGPIVVEVGVANAFGTITRRMPDGSTKQYPFDPTGPISLAWLARAKQEMTFPRAAEWWEQDGWQFVSFGDNPARPLWLLGGPITGRATLTWLDDGPGGA
jgi:hypothetical protein